MLVNDLVKFVYKKSKLILFCLTWTRPLTKLATQNYGIRGSALKWVKGFLDNRHQSRHCKWIFIQTYTCLIWSTSGICAETTSLSNLHKWFSSECQIQSETLRRWHWPLSYNLNISQSEILQKDLDNLEYWSHKWDVEFLKPL